MYCTVDDVKSNLYRPILAQMTAQRGSSVDSDIEKHIQNATNYVDAVLSGVFSTPFDTPAPEPIKTAAALIATYFVMAQFSEKEELSADRMSAASAILDAMIRSGKIPGNDDSGDTASAKTVRGGSDEQVFTASVLSEW